MAQMDKGWISLPGRGHGIKDGFFRTGTGPDLRPAGFLFPTIQNDQGIVTALTDFGRQETCL